MIREFHQISLRGRNSFGVDQRAARLVEFETAEDLRTFFAAGIPGRWTVLAGGNNILFTEDYDGVLLTPVARQIALLSDDGDEVRLRVEAGVEWDDLVEWAVERGLWGIENLSLIPGKAGSAPVQNIGAYGCEAKDAIRRVEMYCVETGNLLTLGVTPSSPHTGYGYIQATTACVDRPGILKVKSFTEKPDLHMAEMFVSSGEFYWNSGMFLWRADSILKAFERYAPEIAAVFNAGNDVYGTPEETAFIDEEFPNAPCISIDYAIMEKASNVYVMTVDFGWSDLGSWKALYEVSPRNRDGNVTQQSRVMAYDCSGCVFHSDPDKVIVAAGLENYIVTQSGNATLIYPLEREQQIRRVVNELGEAFGDRYL